MVTRALTKLVINKIGQKARAKRRQEIYTELKRQDVSEDTLAELWPYVATAVDHGGSMTLIIGGVLGLVPLGIVLFGGAVMIEGGIAVGLVIAVIGTVILRYTSWRLYKQWRYTNELIADLKTNHRTVPETEVYNWLVEKTDFRSGQAYPDDAPVDRQDVLDKFEIDDKDEQGGMSDLA